MADYNSAYTGQEIDAGIAKANAAVPGSRKVNGKALSSDVTLSAADVGALPTSGGTMTGQVQFNQTEGTILSFPVMDSTFSIRLYEDPEGYQTARIGTDSVYMEIKDDGTGYVQGITLNGNVSGISKSSVGLGNVDNTSDANKPISTATQNALNGKQATVTGGASTITSSNLTANRALVSNGSGKVAVSAVTSTELGYLDGVTSNVQNQLNEKIPASPIFTYTLSGSSDGQDFATSTFGFSSYAMIQILINAKFVSSDDVRAYVRFNQGANIYYANSPGSNSTSGNNVEITTMNVKGDYGISAKIELQEMSGGIVGTLYGYGFNGTTLDYNVKGFYIPGVTFASLTAFGILKSGVSYAAGTTCAFYGVMKP